MQSITIRNIPDEIMDIIRVLSRKEKRSINSELLLLLENGVSTYIVSKEGNKINSISIEAQIDLWNNISGKWKDKRKTGEIINDIYESRTLGREIDL
ncbi:hypothetical protein HZA55_02810 [Candidatus Poribacteria bacterium]|nr:hypothetical protein [Candidatus Poribacteria bacterium]